MRIFAIEDSPVELSRIRRMITEVCPEAQLTAFSDSGDVLTALDRGEPMPDVVFLDIEMPAPNGIELAKQLCARSPGLNVVFTTAYSDYMPEAFRLFASGYILKPFSAAEVRTQLEHLRYPVKSRTAGFYVKTLGQFEIFYADKPVSFSSVRAKELLAYLIDRDGASVTKKEIAAVLFEDAEYSSSKQDYLKKIVKALKDTLEQYDASRLLVHQRNSYSVDTSYYTRDLDELTARGETPAPGTGYMEQYSWAECRFY